MLQLERALAEHDIVILHGFGGMGKTALAAEAGRWFYRTGRFPGGAAFVSFEHGGSLSQLCSWVGQAVSGDPNFVLGEGDPVERVAALLQERPALVILDNFESVLGREPLMPPEELKVVLDAVWKWGNCPARVPACEGKPNILITTRDTAFNDARFGPSKSCAQIELGGLARSDALELAAAVLDDYGINRTSIGRQDLVDLMERLGGHPLSLYLVLPQLKDNTPAELSDQFEQLLPGFITGAAKERNESLTVSLEFSLRRLGEETRAALPALAVFEGGAMEPDLLAITEIDPELWKVARAELEQAALVSVELLPGVEPPFLRFHPTLVPYLATQLPAERRTVLEERYRERYYALTNTLYSMDTQHPHEARAIALLEMPNLRRAFELTVAVATSGPELKLRSESARRLKPAKEGASASLSFEPEALASGDAQAAAIAVDFADNIARFLNYFGRWRERDALLARLTDLHVTSDKGLTKAEFLMLSQRGEVLWQQGRAAEAEQVFRDLLTKMEAGAAYDAVYEHAITLVRLGRCLDSQGRPAQAIEYFRRALQEFEKISESTQSAKGMVGTVHTELADLHAALGQFGDAEREYKAALVIDEEVGDYKGKGVNLGQLVTLAMRRGDLQEATRQYTEALKTFRALGEPQTEAVAWHQLGMVAWKAQDWDEAELYARRALEIKETLDLSAAPWITYNILAKIAGARGRADEATQWRRKEQDSYAAYAGSSLSVQKWEQEITVIAAACQGDTSALELAEQIIERYQDSEDWGSLIAAFRRILDGEREIETLRGDLDHTDFVIVRALLAQLAGETPSYASASPSPKTEKEQAEEEEGMSLQDFLALIVQACQPDAPPGLAEQLHASTRAMSADPNAPAELRALFSVLNQILSGERAPDLPALPPELAALVRGILGEL